MNRLYVPLVSQKQQVIGALSADLPTKGLREEYQSVLRRFATVAVMAMDHLLIQTQIESVLDAARAGTSRRGMSSFLETVDRAARSISPDLSAFTLWYRNPESRKIIWDYASGVNDTSNLHKPENPDARSLVWDVMRAPRAIWSENVQSDDRLNRRFVFEEGIVAAAAFPLRVDKFEVGAMFVNYRHEHVFTTEEKRAFSVLASVVAIRIRDAIQIANIRRSSKRLEATQKISELILSNLSLDRLLPKIVSILNRTFKNASSMVALYNSDEKLLEFTPETMKYYKIDNPQFLRIHTVSLDDKAIAVRVAKETLRKKKIQVALVNEVGADPDYLPTIMSTSSELCASLAANGNLLGVLVLERSESPGFEPEDIQLIKVVAEQISLVIDRTQRMEDQEFRSIVASSFAWASDLAHDYKNDVGKIRNYSYLILHDQVKPEAMERYLKIINESAERISKSIPWLSKAELIELDPFILGNIQSLTELKDLTVEFQLNSPGTIISCTPIALQIVLKHLVQNADEAMVHSPVRHITIKTIRIDPEKVEIHFEDTGPGMNTEIRQLVFHQRIPKKITQGGYGLLFTRQLVEEMHGRIKLLPPQVGKGAMFIIRLPVYKPANLTRNNHGCSG